MNYRMQDIMKLIIPGLYVLAFFVGRELLSPNSIIDVSRVKDFTSIILLLIPFVGFVVGYFLECLMSAIEHLFYYFGCRRPSKTILDGGIQGVYTLSAKEKILAEHKVSEKITNKKANEILQIAKQSINRDIVEVFRLNSMLARNIYGGQIIITILYAFISPCFYKDSYFYGLLIISLLFLMFWIHQMHVYVKYVLAEYGKTLE